VSLAGSHRLRQSPLLGAEAERFLGDVSPERRIEQAWLVSPDGRRWGGAEAIWHALYLSPALNLLLRPLRWIPGFHPIGNRVYRWVADQRDHAGCRLDSQDRQRKRGTR